MTTPNPLSNPKVGGATSATASASYLWVQPPPVTNIRVLNAPFDAGASQPIYRGYMSWDPNVTWVDPYSKAQNWSGAPKVQFLYNPSTISASYSIDNTNGAQASMTFPVSNTGSTGSLVMPLQQTLGFTIMFDRTYEMWYNSYASVDQLGCEVDVIAMKQFTGMFSNAQSLGSSGSSSAGGGNTNPYSIDTSSAQAIPNMQVANPNQGGLLQGIMTYVQSYFFFSQPPTGLMYYGVVNNWDVQYTHFAQDMRPMRCVIDVSVNLLPPVTPGGGTGGGGGGATTITTQQAAAVAAAGPGGANAPTPNPTGRGTVTQTQAVKNFINAFNNPRGKI